MLCIDIKCLNECKNEDSLTWKIKSDAENISIPSANFKRDTDFKK